jgi:hypothetical protein
MYEECEPLQPVRNIPNCETQGGEESYGGTERHYERAIAQEVAEHGEKYRCYKLDGAGACRDGILPSLEV